jgi:hypothetical protein
MEQNCRGEADSHSASQEILAFYGTRTFITVFTTARHWTLSWARWIQSTPSYFPTILYNIISRLRLGLPSGGFPTKTVYTFRISSLRTTWPAHLISLTYQHAPTAQVKGPSVATLVLLRICFKIPVTSSQLIQQTTFCAFRNEKQDMALHRCVLLVAGF